MSEEHRSMHHAEPAITPGQADGGTEEGASGASGVAPPRLPFGFTGTGSEYFRIWIVNTMLTVVTLGIYSAWAKVRTLQYFYRNTRLDGAIFDYHGRPAAILKGRAIVFGLAVVFQFSSLISPWLSIAMVIALGVALPLLLVRSLRFRMANSSYRGLRFAFTGSDGAGYRTFLLWPLAMLASVFLLAPLAHHRLKRFQHESTRFGTARFGFEARARGFYGAYLWTFAMILAILLIASTVQLVLGGLATQAGNAAGSAVSVALGGLAFYVAALAVGPFFTARIQNLVWNHTTLGAHRFRSEVKPGRLFFIYLTNLVAIVLTLGLYLPFARIRTTRYRVQCMTMLAAEPLDTFVAGETMQSSALGDAAVDWYDIDLAL